MPISESTKKPKKIHIKKSPEIVFKQPSLFRKVVSFVTAYSMMFLNITPALATNITGVQGNNGVYDIDAKNIAYMSPLLPENNYKVGREPYLCMV